MVRDANENLIAPREYFNIDEKQTERGIHLIPKVIEN